MDQGRNKKKKVFCRNQDSEVRWLVSKTGQGLKASVAQSYSLAAQTSLNYRTHCSPARQTVAVITQWKAGEIKVHVYGKRQTSDASW